MISVCIPVYNGELYIINALESIKNQNIKDIEILIAENNSKDNTLQIIKEYKKNNIPINIRILTIDKTISYAKNWNRCFEFATNKYVIILHADDLLKPKTIEKHLNFFNKNQKVAIVGGHEDEIDENGNITFKRESSETQIYEKDQIFEFISQTGSYIPCSSVMYDMEKIREVGYFQDVLGTDELYWPKILLKFPIAILGESLIYRRTHENQTEYNDFKNKPKEIISVGKEFEKIIYYEKRYEKRKNLRKFLQKKMAYALARNIFSNCILYHHAYSIGLYYLIHCVKIYPQIIFEISFWKTISKTLLLSFGLIKTK